MFIKVILQDLSTYGEQTIKLRACKSAAQAHDAQSIDIKLIWLSHQVADGGPLGVNDTHRGLLIGSSSYGPDLESAI